MKLPRISPLVTCSFLKSHMPKVNCSVDPCSPEVKCRDLGSRVRVLDTSWSPKAQVDGYTEYFRKGHIPGAVHFDLDAVQHRGREADVLWPIPPPPEFQQYARRLGIAGPDHLVVYASTGAAPAARTWFLFRLFGHDNISVLDGGMGRWVAEGNDLQLEEGHHSCLSEQEGNGPDHSCPSCFEVTYRPELLVSHAQMVEIIDQKSAQIIDARAGPRLKLMPGALNVPFPRLFQPDGTFKPKDQLESLFQDRGVDLQARTVVTCNSGMTACGLALACAVVGRGDVAVYNGSFHEWSRKK